MESILIRQANKDDAEGIAEVHVRTWQSAYRGQIPDSYLDNLSIERKADDWRVKLENRVEGVYPLVAEIDSKVVGFCTVGKSRDEDVDQETGELYAIYVLSEYSGKGVGSMLMEKGNDLLRNKGYTKAILWVLDSNEKTKKWYTGKGWRVEGKTKIDEHSGGFNLHEARYIIDL